MATLTVPVSDRDHIEGPDNAPVTLVEYGDYESSYCGQAYYVLQKLLEDRRGEVRFVYRNLPLTQVHQYAFAAALAAEAAALQGRFWEMHDLQYQHQDTLEPEHLLAFAQVLGLDIEDFIIDITSEELAERVRQDFMSGIRSGANGAPTLFINSHRHNGAYDYQTLHAAVDKAAKSISTKRSKHETKPGDPPRGRYASPRI